MKQYLGLGGSAGFLGIGYNLQAVNEYMTLIALVLSIAVALVTLGPKVLRAWKWYVSRKP